MKLEKYKGLINLNLEQTMKKEKMTIFKDLIDIFKALCGTNYKNILPNSKFRKLAYFEFMKNSKFSKADYDILYKRIKKSDSGQMDFYGFIDAIEYIAEKLHPKTF